MPRQPRIPSYRLHKPTGQAVVTIDGKDHYLALHGRAFGGGSGSNGLRAGLASAMVRAIAATVQASEMRRSMACPPAWTTRFALA
jgi:hypothetical protein